MQEIAKESAKAAAVGILSEFGSQQIESVFKIANEADSVARKLMKDYTGTEGLFLKTFFDELLIAVTEF
ncbi:MAG: hypothetical protein IKV97_02345 [Clostridia bacterium]|nr:hypothetical protein [Clostridia bacterium]